MPSNQLTALCEQIENQPTDHIGKYYMYAALLNTLPGNQSFAEGLPKYSGSYTFWKENKLNIGELSVDFTGQLNAYAREFMNPQPGWTKALQNIILTYFRRGKIRDLIHIIDQMLNHLTAIHGEQSHNNAIYGFIHFEENREKLLQFIRGVSDFNHQLLATVDSGCNTALSIMAVVIGLSLVIASVSGIAPLLIGLPLFVMGAYGIYHYASQAKEQFTYLVMQFHNIGADAKELLKDENMFGDENYSAFYAAAIKPLPYAAIKAGEQLMLNELQQQALEEKREELDQEFRTLSL